MLRPGRGSLKFSAPAWGTMMVCDYRTPRAPAPLPRCYSLPECGAVDGPSSGKVLSSFWSHVNDQADVSVPGDCA